MAFLQQYRSLCRKIKQQLDGIDDDEKGHAVNTSPSRSNSSHDDEKEFPYVALDGISVQSTDSGDKYYLVDFESEIDPANPHNWSIVRRTCTTFVLIMIAFEVTAASSIDSAVAPLYAEEFGISEVVASLSGTAIFLIGFGLGALLAAPASEMVGRWPVYTVTLILFGCWLVGAALAPNVGAQIVFRGLAGLCGSAPLTVAGGTMSDMWNAKQKTLAFPLFAIVGFGGPVLGPVIASYFGLTGVLSWRWSEWIMLIADGLVLVIVLLFMPETLAPRLLKFKAGHLRKLTGDQRFKSATEAAGHSTGQILKTNFTRPFILAVEPIVILYTLYLTVIYIVLFTFLDGYPMIFEKTYGINPGLSNICFNGLLIGILLSIVTVPLVWRVTTKQLARDGDDGTGKALNQETRIIFSMIGAPVIPIGLFWMAWTDYPHVSIWSPLAASVMIGFGIVLIFMSAYMYIIDSYQTHAASALTFVALVRYLAAGGMTVVGVPMYKNLGTHWTLTLLGCIAAVVVPIPFFLYKYGEIIRAKSQYAVSSQT